MVIHRAADDPSAAREPCRAGAFVAGLFEDHAIALVDEESRTDLEGLLRAAGDEHVGGRPREATGRAQPARNLLLQRRVAGGGGVAEGIASRATASARR